MKKIVALLLCFLISGCSIALPTENTESENKKEAQTKTSQKSNTITFSISGTAEFQPHSEQNPNNRKVLGLFYEPMFYMSALNSISPCLASSISSNGTSAEVTLKDGVLWHDGDKLCSADVVYTINLMLNGYSVYSVPEIVSAKTNGAGKVIIYFSKVVSKPEASLTFPIVKNNSSNHLSEPNGTGPFRYQGMESFDTFVFKANEAYHNGQPKISIAKIINIKNEENAKALYDCGETDVFFLDTSTISAFTPRANKKTLYYPSNLMVYLGFNCERIEKSVRQAIYYALDTSNIVSKTFGSSATKIDYPVTINNISQNSYSIEKAEEIMHSAGYTRAENGLFSKNGEALKIPFLIEDEKYQSLFETVSSKLESFGIKCEKLETSYYYENFSAGDYSAVIGTDKIGITPDYFLKTQNLFKYENADLFALFEGTDISKMTSIIENDSPIIPIAMLNEAISISPKISVDTVPLGENPLININSWIIN